MSASDIIIAQLRSELAAKQSTIDMLIAANAELTKAPVNTIHYEKHPVGTKLKWVSAENPNIYRVAIATSDGILQVKSMGVNGVDLNPNPDPLYGSRLNRTTFADEAAWRASLPEGEVTLTMKQSLKDKTMIPVDATNTSNDGEKLKMVMERFKVPSRVYKGLSTNGLMDYHRECLTKYPDSRLGWQKSLDKVTATFNSQTDEQNNYEHRWLAINHKKQKLYIIVGDTIKEIGYDLNNDTYVIVDSEGKHYKNFAEIGDCLSADGKPRICIHYRNKIISAANLF